MQESIFRNTCPRNCYGTCSILSHVKDGKLIKVTGDPKQGFNQGRLCAKGYAYTQFVYNPHRLKYPMIQLPRGSGNWNRISWNEAYSIIADKIIELHNRYHSNLSCAYNKYSGNLGILHYAVEGMFNSIGPHTNLVGDPCFTSGALAINESLGQIYSSIPENMANAKLIVLWGANPAFTNVHQMKFIYQARKKGAIFVCIDPIFTRTAEKADLFIQIYPGTDVFLALGVAKLLIEKEDYNVNFVQEQTVGWEAYKKYVEQLNMSDICQKTGVSLEAITSLANLYANRVPVATWAGLGIQRNKNGRNSISAILALSTMTGNLLAPNCGIYYLHNDITEFPNKLLHHSGPSHPSIKESRHIDINDFAENALSLQDPPLKFLWIASRNPLTQDQNLVAWKNLFTQLDLIVTVDLYLTKTAEQSDIVLPATTQFEEYDLNVGYWHHWLSLNQKAISSYYEAKSDLQIARELTQKLNELSPGFSIFPSEKEPLDWIREELTPKIMDLYEITGIEDLFKGPHQKKYVSSPLSHGRKFRFFSPEGLSRINVGQSTQGDSFRLLSPQSLLKIHSQFEWLSWLNDGEDETIIELPSEIAKKYEITDQSKVEIFNEYGSIIGKAKVNDQLPINLLLTNQAGHNPINQLIFQRSSTPIDETNTLFYDSMVKIKKWMDSDV